MGYRPLARVAFMVAAGIGILSCGGGDTSNTGTGGATGGAGRGGTGGAAGTATAGTIGAGGGGGVTACGTVQPCGGGPVGGTWSFVSQCVDLGTYNLIMQQELGCPQARVTAVDVSNRFSSFTFSSDFQYSLGQNVTATITFNMPISCINNHTCTDWATTQSLSVGAAFSCHGTTSCACTETISDSYTDTGSYSVSGTNINITSSVTGASSAIAYCIQGESTIHFITVDPNTIGPGGQPTIVKDIVAERS